MVICLERGADLHMAQLMPLPLTVTCFNKIQIGFTWLTWVVPDKGLLNVCVCTSCTVFLLTKFLMIRNNHDNNKLIYCKS